MTEDKRNTLEKIGAIYTTGIEVLKDDHGGYYAGKVLKSPIGKNNVAMSKSFKTRKEAQDIIPLVNLA